MSLCNSCKRKMKTWSEELQNEGYLGCGLLMCTRFEELSDREIASNIKAETLAKGWVTNGKMMTNYQLITKNVSACVYFGE